HRSPCPSWLGPLPSGCLGEIPRTLPLLLLLIQAHRKKSGHGKSFCVDTMRRSWRIIISVLIMSGIAMLPFHFERCFGGIWLGVVKHFLLLLCLYLQLLFFWQLLPLMNPLKHILALYYLCFYGC